MTVENLGYQFHESVIFKTIVRFLGSIKLAIPLLSAVFIILIGATFYESQVGSTTVQQEIYKSSWFGSLMFLLAVNLGVSALSRYPWRGMRKIGFALTHLGLIVIIAGSAAVIHLGVEGMLLLRTDGLANNQIRIAGDLLEVMSPDGTGKQVNLFIKADGSVNPRSVGGLSLLDYSDNAIKTVKFTEAATVNNPAVHLSLTSSRMGQRVDRWLAIAPVAYRKLSLGPAEFEIFWANNPDQLNSLLSPPVETTTNPWGTLQIHFDNQQKTVDVIQPSSQSFNLGTLSIQVANFWSDFRLDANNQPISASSRLNNPAVQLELSTPQGKERWFVFGRGNFPPVRSLISGEEITGVEISYEVSQQQSEDYFHVIVTPENELFYAAKSSQGFQSGTLILGQTVSPGWADFEITLEDYLPHSQLHREVVPAANPSLEGTPALLVETPTGIQSWLGWGEPTVIEDPNGEWLAAFSPTLLSLPFAIKLENFIVDRNEGSDSVAMWTSQIRIEDPHNGIIERRNVWMNHPTWYQGWKIAQASWNPGDLQQSTLQIKREPLWVTALTWSGSASIIIGIVIMFYGSAIAKKLPKLRNTL